MPWTLSAADRNLLITLTRKVRLICLTQVERLGYSDSREARRALQRLIRARMLTRVSVLAHPERRLEKPLFSWLPGDPAPNYGSLAYRVQTRWSEPLRITQTFIATNLAARYFAGKSGGLKRPLQASHDLHVTTVYLHMLRSRPADAEAWVSEDLIAPFRRRQKLPDAMLQFSDGRPPVVIEFAGSYRRERIERVHADCERRGLAYELW